VHVGRSCRNTRVSTLLYKEPKYCNTNIPSAVVVHLDFASGQNWSVAVEQDCSVTNAWGGGGVSLEKVLPSGM
jgi:hypothetical protein